MSGVQIERAASSTTAPDSLLTHHPKVIIQPRTGWATFDLRELWSYRDLLIILAARDIKLRYKQTVLGIIWVILQPLVAALIFAVIFGRFASLPSNNVPYVVFVFCGLLPWNFFAGALQRAGNSLITDSRLISKVYFPRLLIPLASIVAVLIDFVVTLLVLVVLMALYQVAPTWRIISLPFFLILTMFTAMGVSLWLSALNVQYRDFMYATPFLIQVWMYASPVVYATSIIPERWQLWYSLNPAVGFIEGFRWALLPQSALTIEMCVVTMVIAVFTLISGALFFRRVERGFADVV